MEKKCNTVPIRQKKWKKEWKYFFFEPMAYSTAPTVYATPPATSSTKPG